MIIAFDTDDCLIIPSVATKAYSDTPNYETIAIYKWFQSQGHSMIVWSGGGVDYARTWGEKLDLEPFAVMKKQKHLCENGDPWVDLSFDDCIVDLAKVNVRVKRVHNSISRKEWNKHKNQ